MIDISIVVVIAGALLLGYYRGFVSQLLSVAGFFIAYFAAYQFYDEFAPWLRNLFPLEAFAPLSKMEGLIEGLGLDGYLYNAIAFALLLFSVKIGLSVCGRVLNLVAKAPGINFINKWSGAILAFAEALLLIVIVVNVMQVWPSEKARSLTDQSKIVQAIDEYTPSINDKLQRLWTQKDSKEGE